MALSVRSKWRWLTWLELLIQTSQRQFSFHNWCFIPHETRVTVRYLINKMTLNERPKNPEITRMRCSSHTKCRQFYREHAALKRATPYFCSLHCLLLERRICSALSLRSFKYSVLITTKASTLKWHSDQPYFPVRERIYLD